MMHIKNVSKLIAKYFGSTANFYITQINDGTYRKTSGRITPELVERTLSNSNSIGSYQRNANHTINWICFDFDILKTNIGTNKEALCEKSLLAAATKLIEYLASKSIAYIAEFSGNRGIHIWIHFAIPITPKSAFSIVKYIVDTSAITLDRTLVGLDLFPSTASHKSLYGKGVKLPLSKHARSGDYAVLLSKLPTHFSDIRTATLDENILKSHIQILRDYIPETKFSIEEKLGYVFPTQTTNDLECWKIFAIYTDAKKISTETILTHWDSIPIVAPLASDIRAGNLTNTKRKLLVGIFNAVVDKTGNNISKDILDALFKRLTNYNPTKTKAALESLQLLPFPSAEVIESICGCKDFTSRSRLEIISQLIPGFLYVDEGLFQSHDVDLEVTKFAELRYIYQNDEVQCAAVIDDLTSFDFKSTNCFDTCVLDGQLEHYRHIRDEGNKKRQLVTLTARNRLFSTWVVKHLAHLYEYKSSPNTFGYRLNENFSNGHIFKPWLYQWIQFLSDISSITKDEVNKSSYVVKADIKSFYDSIPHDTLERFLLTGINSDIRANLNRLQKSTHLRYKTAIETLMQLTRACTGLRKGVPQGPAYARYLAELYLNPIDEMMDELLGVGDISFYHRYVDDIFFTCPSEALAKTHLENLRNKLALLGLTLNDEKTGIFPMKNFGTEFDKYRSQAKYTIDSISKNISTATDYEKEAALLEFNRLINLQDENSDALFLFSHLPGLEFSDRYRDQKTIPIIREAKGRGSLFRHVFKHLLQSKNIWGEFAQIIKLSALQSEVFTSVCIETLFENKDIDHLLVEFIEQQLDKLTSTKVASQHLTLLKLYFDLKINSSELNADTVLKCVSVAEDPSRLVINNEILQTVNSTLNGIDDIGQFIFYLYPICIAARPDAETLNAFGEIFFAKLRVDDKRNALNFADYRNRLKTPKLVVEFYQLLCLFSVSKSVPTQQLLENAWKVCTELFSDSALSSDGFRRTIWIRNFDLIVLDSIYLNKVISSISENALWRGPSDILGIYQHFHNALVVFLLTGNYDEYIIDYSDLVLNARSKGPFYDWLFSKEASLFPTRKWFLLNMEYNDCMLLSRKGELLIRKRKSAFVGQSALEDFASPLISGYSDCIVPYTAENHTSIFNLINAGDSFIDTLQNISRIVEKQKSNVALPNFFSKKSLVNIKTEVSFTEELCGNTHLIFDGEYEEIEYATALLSNFVRLLFLTTKSNLKFAYSTSKVQMTAWLFYQTCVVHMGSDKELTAFLRRVAISIKESTHTLNEVTFDLVVSSSLYSLKDDSLTLSKLSRVKIFFGLYNKIHNTASTKHIYKCHESDLFSKNTLDDFLSSITLPLKHASEYRPGLSIALLDDLKSYFSEIREVALSRRPNVGLQDFISCTAVVSIVNEKITIDGARFDRSNVKVINVFHGAVESFSDDHVYLVQATQDSFCLKLNATEVALFFVPREISICFSDIEDRRKLFFNSNTLSFGSLYIDNLDTYHGDLNRAIQVIASHRDILLADAERKLRRWLSHIPVSYRSHVVTFIEAHEFMTSLELQKFRDEFSSKRTANENIFLLKRSIDNGGVHRILGQSDETRRILDTFGPDSIRPGAQTATLFVELALKGTQWTSALEYYLSPPPVKLNSIYFGDTETERLAIGERIRSLRTLQVCAIFYTMDSLNKLKNVMRKYSPDLEISVILGRDISANAFLGSTQNISVALKAELKSFLSNTSVLDQLSKVVFSLRGHEIIELQRSLKNLDGINLVARYKSMPKKALSYLTMDFPNLPKSSVFVRVKEIYEMGS